MDKDKIQNEIFRTILIIRECMKKEFDHFPISCCYETSLVAERVFHEFGYDIKTIEGVFDGAEHFWNNINGFLLDLTSDQFMEPYGIISNCNNYSEISEYSLEEELMYLEEDDEMFEEFEDLEELKHLINRISNRCIRIIKLNKCA